MKNRFDRIARMGCIVCRIHLGVFSPTQIHHLTGIKYRATGKKAKDEHTIGLCYAHHIGSYGIHKLGMRVWEAEFGTQESLLQIVDDWLETTGG